MTNEIWENAVGYSPYLISNLGRVKRPEGFVDSNGRKRPEVYLKPHRLHSDARPFRKSRGPYVSLSLNGTQRHKLVSELVAKAFVDENYDKQRHDLRFRDADPSNCQASNIVIFDHYSIR